MHRKTRRGNLKEEGETTWSDNVEDYEEDLLSEGFILGWMTQDS